MAVNDVVLANLGEDGVVALVPVCAEVVAGRSAMPECLSHDGHQPGGSVRIPGREQCHVMPSSHQLLRQRTDDAFGAAVAKWGNRFERRCELRDTQVHVFPSLANPWALAAQTRTVQGPR